MMSIHRHGRLDNAAGDHWRSGRLLVSVFNSFEPESIVTVAEHTVVIMMLLLMVVLLYVVLVVLLHIVDDLPVRFHLGDMLRFVVRVIILIVVCADLRDDLTYSLNISRVELILGQLDSHYTALVARLRFAGDGFLQGSPHGHTRDYRGLLGMHTLELLDQSVVGCALLGTDGGSWLGGQFIGAVVVIDGGGLASSFCGIRARRARRITASLLVDSRMV